MGMGMSFAKGMGMRMGLRVVVLVGDGNLSEEVGRVNDTLVRGGYETTALEPWKDYCFSK